MRRHNRPVHLWLLAAAFAVYALTLGAVALIGPASVDRAAAPAAPPTARGHTPDPVPPVTLPSFVGMNLNVYHAADMEIYHRAVDRIAETGFNAVQVVTPMFQPDGASPSVEVIEGPYRGPMRSDLVALLRYARSRGLRTSLMPQVNFTRPRGNEWRGKIAPDRWAPWWRSYEAGIVHFSEMATEADADAFVVGCELLSTQKAEHLEAWRSVIAAVRERFDGLLAYSSTWDSYASVPIWRDLDVIGISGYWDLTTGAADPANPTDEELRRRWSEVRQRLLDFAEAQGRPLLLTEVGYPSLPWALSEPWNYVGNGGAAAPAVQARGYGAFLHAWDDLIDPHADTPRDPRVLGVLFYKWDVYGDEPSEDTGYGVAGKPAHDTLRRWLAPAR